MREELLERAQGLAARLLHLGMGPDLAAMSVTDLWGACCYLQRLANG